MFDVLNQNFIQAHWTNQTLVIFSYGQWRIYTQTENSSNKPSSRFLDNFLLIEQKHIKKLNFSIYLYKIEKHKLIEINGDNLDYGHYMFCYYNFKEKHIDNSLKIRGEPKILWSNLHHMQGSWGARNYFMPYFLWCPPCLLVCHCPQLLSSKKKNNLLVSIILKELNQINEK